MARTKGSKNRITKRRERKIQAHADAIREMIGEQNYFDGDAHAFLMYIYKDRRRDIDLRIEAAKSAIAYEKPKLAAVALKNTGDVPLQQSITLEFVDPPVWDEKMSGKIIDHDSKKSLASQVKFVS